jgi:putative two-component system response regulator
MGANILSGSPTELMRTARIIAQHHHEKWDGSGYPQGLREEEISIAGRICALADVFDALTSRRPYKSAWGLDETLAFIIAQSGKHFDPRLVPLLTKNLPEILAIKEEHADEFNNSSLN